MLSESLTRQALQRHQEGFLEEGEDLYRQPLRTDANNFQALQLLGTLTLRGKRYHEALDFSSLLLFPSSMKHLIGRGGSLYQNSACRRSA
jgi:cytochrome c-type biogenesis protein CcmH/NrfG